MTTIWQLSIRNVLNKQDHPCLTQRGYSSGDIRPEVWWGEGGGKVWGEEGGGNMPAYLHVCIPQIHVVALNPDVMVFRDGVFGRQLMLNEVMRRVGGAVI